MRLFRALNPDMDNEAAGLLENSLNKKDNSLFTLLMTSEWEAYKTNKNAINTFFEYIKAGWALVDATTDQDTPIQQRAALKVLIRSIHMNPEKELDRFEEEGL